MILNAIHKRRSIRRFKDHLVDKDTLLTCLEAARLAPSAENSQPWRFVILKDPEKIRQFSETAFTGIYKATQWAAGAPAIIALCADLDFLANRMGRLFQGIPFYLLDTGMAGEHLVLQAAELGLGTCWIGWFDVKRTRKFLKLPRKIRLCALIALGYPAEEKSGFHKRKNLQDLVHWNTW